MRAELADAAAKQMQELAFFPLWSYAHPASIELAERLTQYTPGDLNRVFFTTGGGEAVESAWKLARQYHRLRGDVDRYKVISRDIAYHGTTMGAMSFTGYAFAREKFEPLAVPTHHVSPTYAFRHHLGQQNPGQGAEGGMARGIGAGAGALDTRLDQLAHLMRPRARPVLFGRIDHRLFGGADAGEEGRGLGQRRQLDLLGTLNRRHLARRPGFEARCSSLEAQVANLADEIAYYSHDLDDGLDSGLLTEARLRRDVHLWRDADRAVRKQHGPLPDECRRYFIIRCLIDDHVHDVVRSQVDDQTRELICAELDS